MSDKVPPGPEITVSYDSFQIGGLVAWIEANGYKPHLLINTSHPGVQLPPQCMAKKQEVINIHSKACGKQSWDDDRMECNSRFNQRDYRLVIPYRSIQAITFAGTNHWIPMPWTVLVDATGDEAVQITAVQEVIPEQLSREAPLAVIGEQPPAAVQEQSATASADTLSNVRVVDFSRGRSKK